MMLYIVRCIIELKTPLHCGGGQGDGLIDAPVSRDAFGLWRIPGSSITGILRSRVHCFLGETLEKSLFGDAGTVESFSSRVWCSDAVLVDFDGDFAWRSYTECRPEANLMKAPSFIRDHVRIDVTTGAAEDGGKFDEEYVPAGTRFAFEITLNGWGKVLEAPVCEAFESLIHDLREGRLYFGGKIGTGYGEYGIIYCEGRHFVLTDAEQMQQFLNLSDGPEFTDKCGEAWMPGADSGMTGMGIGISGTIEIPLQSTGPLLIAGGPVNEQADADMCFATTAFCNYAVGTFEQRFVVPGSSLRGVLRHRVRDILKTLRIAEPENVWEGLFGSVKKGSEGKGKIAVADAGITMSGADVSRGQQVVPHVAIDRFTGGAIDGCLFNEAPLWSDVRICVRIRFDNLTELEAALLGHALLDLSTGNLPVGGGANRGNGWLHRAASEPVKYEIFRQNTRIAPQEADWHSLLDPLDKALQQVSNTTKDLTC